MLEGSGVALGLLIGNWLLVPVLFKGRTFKQGLMIGIISALIALAIFAIL